jgi:hypothetical protein
MTWKEKSMADPREDADEAEQWIGNILRNTDGGTRYTQAVMLEAARRIHRLARAARDGMQALGELRQAGNIRPTEKGVDVDVFQPWLGWVSRTDRPLALYVKAPDGAQACDSCGGAGTVVTWGGGQQKPCPKCAAGVMASHKPAAMIEAQDARKLADELEKLRCDHWTHWSAQENHIAATAVRHLRLLAEHNARGVMGMDQPQQESRDA